MIAATKSEVLKIFTTRMWWGMAIGMAVLAALIAVGFASLVGSSFGENPGSGANPFATVTVGTAQLIYNAGIVQSITVLFPLALGVLLITTEFRHKTITGTLLCVPKRSVVLVSKVLALIVIGAAYAVIHATASIAGGAGTLLIKGEPTLLSNGQVWQSLGTGILAFIVWMLLGFGFGMLVQNQIAAVLAAVGVAFIAQIALNIIFSITEWSLAAKLLPGNLTTGMLVTVDPTGGQAAGDFNPYFDQWWVSALILVAYAVVLAGLGTLRTARQDIT